MRSARRTYGEMLYDCRHEAITRTRGFLATGARHAGLLTSAMDRARAIYCSTAGITQDAAGAEELLRRLENHDVSKHVRPEQLRQPV